MSEVLQHRETESGISGIIIAERYSLERMFQPEFSRPEPAGGRWFQIGPFGRAGEGRPKGVPVHLDGRAMAEHWRKPGTGSVQQEKSGRWLARAPQKKRGTAAERLGSFGSKEEAEDALDRYLSQRREV